MSTTLDFSKAYDHGVVVVRIDGTPSIERAVALGTEAMKDASLGTSRVSKPFFEDATTYVPFQLDLPTWSAIVQQDDEEEGEPT